MCGCEYTAHVSLTSEAKKRDSGSFSFSVSHIISGSVHILVFQIVGGIAATLPAILNSGKLQDTRAFPITSNGNPIALRFCCDLSGENRGKILQTESRDHGHP